MRVMYWLIGLAALIVIVGAAFGLTSTIRAGRAGGSESADLPAQAESLDTFVPQGLPASDANPSAGRLPNIQAGLEALDSYQTTLNETLKDSSGNVLWSISIITELDRASSASRVLFSSTGAKERGITSFDALEIISSGESQWARFGDDDWASVSPDQDLLAEIPSRW